ncbi:MAG: aminotransferase class IV [Rickettsiales bacterium]|nr:aminotransferase class IV [Rickettsiales bacterium]
MTHISINGRLVTEDRAKIDCRDRGFRFGDGVFETVAIYGGKLYQWDLHYARMLDGLVALKIPEPKHKIPLLVSRLLKKHNANNGFVRIAISRGVGSKGYLPTDDCEPTLVIEYIPRSDEVIEPAKLWLSQLAKLSNKTLPTKFKLAQGVNSTLALIEAVEHECDEALMLNVDGQICESSSANIFWIKKDTVFTPSLDTGCLNGTTRDLLLRLTPTPVRHSHSLLAELETAEAVFLTNCNWIMRPVSELQPLGWKWPTKHPILKQLKALYLDDVRRYLEKRPN